MAAKSKNITFPTPPDSRPWAWRLATHFAAIGMTGFVAWAIFDAAREDRLQRDAALSEQRNLRLEMRDLKDKLAAFSASLAAGETP